MENSSSMKAVLLKAGIPLAISLAGYIYVKIIARRSMNHEASSKETLVSPLGTDCQQVVTSSVYRDDDDEEKIVTSSNLMSMISCSEIRDIIAYEEDILRLRRRIEELQKREWELERRFVRFCELKEQESVLMGLRNLLVLQSLYVEFLNREISSMDDENQRVKNMVIEYFKVVEQLENYKSQNGLLQRKVKRLLRKTKGQSKIIREKDLKIEAKEAEITRNGEELEGRANVTKNVEDEVRKLKAFTNDLQEQKNELSQKLEMAENSLSSISKVEEEGLISIDDCNQLASEYEQVQKERADEIKELIFLRWCNACLRYELKRYQLLQQYVHMDENKDHLEQDFQDGGEKHQDEPCLDAIIGDQVCSKRQNLLRKFKKWVEGDEKMKSKLDGKEKHENKCFRRLSQVQGEHLDDARKSCSSV